MTLKEIICSAQNILIVGHINPDGDCLGSGLALKYVCERLGKTATLVSDSPLPAHYAFMKGSETLNAPFNAPLSTVFALDCGDEARLGRFADYFRKAAVSVNIDHHATNNSFGKINFVTKNASSTCEILSDIFFSENLMDKQAAEYLFIGLSTDTGHFMHSNTSPKVFETAAKLCAYGIDNYAIVRNLYRSNTQKKTKLIARAISRMRFFEDGKVCIIGLESKDLAECDCALTDTENLIDYAINIGTVTVAACITESGRNTYKVSFRSKAVSIIPAAAVFGGGGHPHASGCIATGQFEDVIDKIKKALTDCLG